MSLELKQSLNLKLTQQLVMTPSCSRPFRLLQLNRMELIDAIHAEMEQNPVLEEEVRQEQEIAEQEAQDPGRGAPQARRRDARRYREAGRGQRRQLEQQRD